MSDRADQSKTGVGSVSVLGRKVYTTAEAGRLLGVHPNTLRYWLHGRIGDREVEPVLRRVRDIDDKLLCWGEFIEAGHLAAYRRQARVPLQRLRDYVDDWQGSAGIPYPLAHLRPYASYDRHLLDHTPDGEAWRHSDGQHQIAGVDAFRSEVEFDLPGSATPQQRRSVAAFAGRIDFDGDTAVSYWPAGRNVGVVVNPTLKAGGPVIKGTATTTRAISGLHRGGDTVEYLADVYELPEQMIEDAIQFEVDLRASRITAYKAA